jgi:hypothetical protein
MTTKQILLLAGGLIALNMAVGIFLVLAPTHVREPLAANDAANTSLQGSDIRSSSARAPIPIRIPIHASGTVLDAMEAYAASSSDFTYGGESYPGMGFFVNKVNGVESTADHFWILYVNGTSSPTGISDTHVVPSDIVEWRYKESTF